MSATERVFVAVPLPAAQRAVLESAIASLRGHGLDRVRWVRVEGIHVTLKFLGDIPASQVEAVGQAMRSAAKDVAPFQLQLASLGVFPNPKRARVIWCGVSGQMEQLISLQERTEQAIVPLGYPRERRPYSPHLTLGRVREGDRPPDGAMLQRAMDAWAPGRAEPWLVDEVCLMRTTLLPGGSIHDVQATAKLSADDSWHQR